MRHDDGRVGGEPVQQRQEGRRDHPFVGDRAGAVPVEQHAVDCDALEVGQRVEHLGADGLEQVGEHRVGQPGLGLAAAGRQHAKAVVPGLFQGTEPQRGLADAGLAADDERRRSRRRGLQKSVTARVSPSRERTTYRAPRRRISHPWSPVTTFAANGKPIRLTSP